MRNKELEAFVPPALERRAFLIPLTKLADKEEAGVCPRAEAIFLAREDVNAGALDHLTDLIQYVLLGRGEERRSWDKGQK